MLFIFGRRTARIGNFIDKDHLCYPCKEYDREITVYQNYFHFCLIPVFPMGAKWMEIHCRNCGDETRTDSIVKKYQSRVKTPFYMFSAVILFAGLAVFWFYWNKNNEKNKIEYVANPAIGDVYNISKDENYTTTHYFMRIVALHGDSVMLLQSHLEYTGFVTDLADDDYFVKDDTLAYSSKQLKQMLDNNEIYAVKRQTSISRGRTDPPSR